MTHSKEPDSDVDSKKGQFVTLLGWGRKNDGGGNQPTPRLKHKDLKVFPQECCNDSWISNTPVLNSGKCGTKSRKSNRIIYDILPNLFQSNVFCAIHGASNKNT